jgi:hypothetical protein
MQEQKKNCRSCAYFIPTPGACNHPKIESMLLIDKVYVSSNLGCVMFKARLRTSLQQTSITGTKRS